MWLLRFCSQVVVRGSWKVRKEFTLYEKKIQLNQFTDISQITQINSVTAQPVE